ncbi:hypothetical protein [Paenibacillus silvae]|uniref:Uncharacterized protein n=1 Tax=Paenibacillus silvae TaxID=1325358 RepID=A0ABQ1ZBL4_9BACL|nr:MULTISPECIES: hypothetical protein [Paenibacillus]MCK6077866.1 hypothetical protein [Paenibacillus silvae]MCK6152065.1 hypothetical protein [Paenibacillus silvae]MCK6270750.1 hypothetical protein [Paenibacillus silvae]GGH56740.1 hypothetical protein GCM10008014_27690 [Paenibacillus silvae]
MCTSDHNTLTKTIIITVNGEPVGRKLIIDSVTYAPVPETDCVQYMHNMEINPPAV